MKKPTLDIVRGARFETVTGDRIAWPVGSIFIAVVSTDPATLLGYGTWVAFAQGKMLIGLDSGDADFDTAETDTGGSKTHSHGYGTIAVANHSAHTHSVTQAAFTTTKNVATTGSTTVYSGGGTTNANTGNPSATLTHTVSGRSAASTVADLPPYIVVYMWKRTA